MRRHFAALALAFGALSACEERAEDRGHGDDPRLIRERLQFTGSRSVSQVPYRLTALARVSDSWEQRAVMHVRSEIVGLALVGPGISASRWSVEVMMEGAIVGEIVCDLGSNQILAPSGVWSLEEGNLIEVISGPSGPMYRNAGRFEGDLDSIAAFDEAFGR